LYGRTIELLQWACGLLHWHWQKMCFQMFCASEEILKNKMTFKRNFCGVACHVGVDCGKTSLLPAKEKLLLAFFAS